MRRYPIYTHIQFSMNVYEITAPVTFQINI